MEYRALYRKYRPQRFAEVIGQGHVTETLAREVTDGTVAHAYLFAGPRGTGKTTTARILAKALNCPDRSPDGEPCGVCVSCVGIAEGASLDVIELDAASHNKVEDIREIRVNAGTVASVGGARRVYILDEAHMLSRAAGNALLKTLEEPPDHVIFVLATTEPYKLLDTIRSRSQRFDFHPVGAETLVGYMADISGRETFTVEDDALELVGRHARGSVRDALSLLEQVAALGSGAVTTQGVTRALGIADRDAFGALVAAVAEGDAPSGLELVARLAGAGTDLRRFVADGLAFFRGLFLTHYSPSVAEIVDEPADVVEEWQRFARQIQPADVLRAVDQLADALLQLREGREERLVVELAVLRMTRPETATDPVSLAARLERVEERLKRMAANPVRPTGAPPPVVDQVVPATDPATVDTSAAGEEDEDDDEPEELVLADAVEEAPAPAVAVAPLEGLDLATFETAWPALVAGVRDDLGPRRHAFFKEARPIGVTGSEVTLGVPARLPFHLEHLKEDDALRVVAERLAAVLLGGAVRIRYDSIDDTEEPEVAPERETRAPDPGQLIEADEGAIDPTDLVVDLLGGEVVE